MHTHTHTYTALHTQCYSRVTPQTPTGEIANSTTAGSERPAGPVRTHTSGDRSRWFRQWLLHVEDLYLYQVVRAGIYDVPVGDGSLTWK